MNRIAYPKEFHFLIAAFLKRQNVEWVVAQIVWASAYVALAFFEITSGKSLSCWLLVVGQSGLLGYLYIIWRWHRRYVDGDFLTEYAEVICFRKFAIMRMHAKKEWLDQEIHKLLGFIQ